MENSAVAKLFVLCMLFCTSQAAPFSVTIDCGSGANKPLPLTLGIPRGNTKSLCDCIEKAFPQGIKDGRVILGDSAINQISSSNARTPTGVSPRGSPGPLGASEPEGSAERLESFQKALQRLTHAVTVFDKLDKYLSDRTRIIATKLAKMYED